jgi:hypothetical protein
MSRRSSSTQGDAEVQDEVAHDEAEVKTRAARPKDKLALPLLLATLDEHRRRRGS